MEQREIIFETKFDINGDFKNFEATKWVVQEFTRRGLKKLFKPVTSTAYTKLVAQFYSNLYIDCNRRGVLFSNIKGKPVEVTTTDIAAALKCNDDHLPVEAQMDAQPESFYISQIIADMCDGQYADNKNNAVEEADIMEEDAPAPQQGGRRRSVVISQNEYDFLRGANQRLERVE
jgi:hypothetical protein